MIKDQTGRTPNFVIEGRYMIHQPSGEKMYLGRRELTHDQLVKAQLDLITQVKHRHQNANELLMDSNINAPL